MYFIANAGALSLKMIVCHQRIKSLILLNLSAKDPQSISRLFLQIVSILSSGGCDE